MADHERIEALHRRLIEERRRLVETAADSEVVPPKGLLAYLGDLVTAALAVEAVLDQGIKPTPSAHDGG